MTERFSQKKNRKNVFVNRLIVHNVFDNKNT